MDSTLDSSDGDAFDGYSSSGSEKGGPEKTKGKVNMTTGHPILDLDMENSSEEEELSFQRPAIVRPTRNQAMDRERNKKQNLKLKLKFKTQNPNN